MKRLKTTIILGFSVLFLPTITHAELIDNAQVSNRAIEQTHATINQRFFNLTKQPEFNIVLDKNEYDSNKLPSNSVSIVVNTETNQSKIVVSKDLEKEIPQEMIDSISSKEGFSLIESGNLESGLDVLSMELNTTIQTSSLGQNTFEYNKKEKEAAKKAEQQKEVERKQAIILYGGTGIVLLLALAGFIIFSIKNKNSFVYKLVNKKQTTELQTLLETNFNDTLSDPDKLSELGLDYLDYVYKGVGIDYKTIQQAFITELSRLFEKELKTIDLSEQTTLDSQLVVERFIKKYVPNYQKQIDKTLKNNLISRYPDVKSDIFDTFAFKKLLENKHITKEIVEEYVNEENKEYMTAIQEREQLITELITNIIQTIDFETNKTELQTTLESVLPNIRKNYVAESSYTLQDIKTKYENDIYKLVAKDRLSHKKLDVETENYLLETMSDYNIAMATEKILNRTIAKAKLLK